MLIDCDRCAMRDLACAECVVSAPPGALEVDPAERQALDVLADSGLVPRLRLVRAVAPPAESAAS